MRWLVPWVCLLRDSHPDIDLRFHTSHEPVALDGVTADIAIRYGDGETLHRHFTRTRAIRRGIVALGQEKPETEKLRKP